MYVRHPCLLAYGTYWHVLMQMTAPSSVRFSTRIVLSCTRLACLVIVATQALILKSQEFDTATATRSLKHRQQTGSSDLELLQQPRKLALDVVSKLLSLGIAVSSHGAVRGSWVEFPRGFACHELSGFVASAKPREEEEQHNTRVHGVQDIAARA